MMKSLAHPIAFLLDIFENTRYFALGLVSGLSFMFAFGLLDMDKFWLFAFVCLFAIFVAYYFVRKVKINEKLHNWGAIQANVKVDVNKADRQSFIIVDGKEIRVPDILVVNSDFGESLVMFAFLYNGREMIIVSDRLEDWIKVYVKNETTSRILNENMTRLGYRNSEYLNMRDFAELVGPVLDDERNEFSKIDTPDDSGIAYYVTELPDKAVVLDAMMISTVWTK